MFSYKRGTDPVRAMLTIVMVYTFYCYWSESTANLVYRDKIADQDRKIAAYRLSRDDELKNAVVLETRLTSCTEQRSDLREQVTSMEQSVNNNQRMAVKMEDGWREIMVMESIMFIRFAPFSFVKSQIDQHK